MKPTKTYRLETGLPEKALVMLVGCGGTGSYAALHLAQLAYAARDQIEIKLVFVDPDRVETKNVARQNFAPCEVGEYKAVTLARRYAAAFGLPITARAECFSAGLLYEFRLNPQYLNLIVGCVDNTAARLDIHRTLVREASTHFVREFAGRNLWWLDSGNHHAHGQVCLGNYPGPGPLLSPLGFALALPLPSYQNPDLIAPEAESAQSQAGLSCADLVAQEVQSRTINKMMAAWIDVYCERLLITRDLRIMSTQIDQRSGAVYSTPISGGQVVELAPAQGPTGLFDDEPDDENQPGCPECGEALIHGYDILDDEEGEVEIVFCNICCFRMRLAEFEDQEEVPASL